MNDVSGTQLWSFAFAAVTIAISLHLFRTWWSLRHIPGPFLASLTNLQRVWWVKTGRAHLYHQAIHKKYGDVVRIGPHMVSFSNPEAITTVYPTRPGFPKSDFYATLRPYTRDRGSMLAVFNTQDEDMHKHIKSPIAPLFSLSNVVNFEGLVEEVLLCLSEQLDRRFVDTGDEIDLGEWLQYFAFDVMGTMSFSRRYGFLEQGHDVKGMLEAIFNFMKTAAPMTQITWLDPWIYKNKVIHSFRRTPGMAILGFVGTAIRERLSETAVAEEKTSVNPEKKDFLARFLEIQKANPNLPPWASTAWTFSNVIAGSDSVGTLIRTVMCEYPIASRVYHRNHRSHDDYHLEQKLSVKAYNLLAYPETLEKLRQELKDANLSLPYPKWKEVRDLPYLDACVQEGARIHPPFALPFERIVPAGGITMLGTYIPEGTLVGGNPYVVNRHEPIFGPRPEEWDPDRWLRGGESHKKKLERSILTFGAGRRVCLGKHIGIFEVKKLIPFLVLNYNINILDPKAFTVENGFFVKQRGFFCTVNQRDREPVANKADSV
ncbi:cytochrome P450 [Penicillium malachiteum]|nr:cytochrome P450 [Penicillium malachiteum]